MSIEGKRKRGRPAGPGDRGAATSTAILDAAEQRFADEGYAATRLQDIADDVGKSVPAIVHFFKDKTSLYAEVTQRLVNDLVFAQDEEAARLQTVGIAHALARVEAWVRFMRRRPALLGFILREMAQGRIRPPDATSWIHRTTQMAHQLAEVIRQDDSTPSDDVIISVVVGTTVYFMVGAVRLEDNEFDASVRAHLDTIHTALCAIIESTRNKPKTGEDAKLVSKKSRRRPSR